MAELNPIISEFIEHYVQKMNFYAHLALMVEEQLRSELGRRGIRAIVSSRAKDPARLCEKLIKRSTREEGRKVYRTPKDVDADIVDLARSGGSLFSRGPREGWSAH